MRHPINPFSPDSPNIAAAILSTGADSAVAIFHQDRRLTYAELRSGVSRVAAALLNRGCAKGERIGILAENSHFQVTAYLGAIRAGMVAVPLQPDLSIETLTQIACDAGIKYAFVSNRFRGPAQAWAVAARLNVLAETDLDGFRDVPANGFPDIDPAKDLAALMFTSGSTGAPKGVMISHHNIDCNTRDIISYMGLQAADRVMVVLPFHYCFGASLLHTHLLAGASLVLNNDFKLFPETTLQELQRTECTGLAGVPSTYQILLRKSRFPQMTFPSLRWFQQAGGKLPNPFIQEMVALFPRVRFVVMYGQTEATARLSYLPAERLADKLGSVGRGLPSTKLEVLKENGTPVTPGSEETGEIVASGENVSLGYWQDSDETQRFFQNRKLHTGDIARVDSDGFIFIVEREREMIKSGGNRVSAKELEDVVAELSQVVEVAVVGGPDELLGEAIHVFIGVAPGASLTVQEVKAHCRKRLPAFKVPHAIHFRGSLPHNSSGKILKLKLKEIIAGRQTDQVSAAECSAPA